MRLKPRPRYALGLLLLLAPGCAADFTGLRLLGPIRANPGRRVGIQTAQKYAERGSQELLYDLYTPIEESGPLPLVILVHGGSWRSGSRDQQIEFAYDLAAHGYVAAAIDYRLTRDGVVFPAPVSDVLAAIRFFREHAGEFNIHPQRIGLFGVSAGAHLALLAGLTNDASVFDAERPAGEPPGVQVIVDLAGPTDFTVDPSSARPDQVSRVEQFLGKPLDEAGELRRAASPITYVRPDGPAVLVIQGDADMTVPVSQARSLVAAMHAAGQRHQYLEVPGMDHVSGAIWQGRYAQGYRGVIFAFLTDHL